ncbi:MAG: sugar isomerase [Pseudomonadota bacterium]
MAAHQDSFDALAAQLGRRGVDTEEIVGRVAALSVAVPSWGVGTGGTRFARFPGPGEPRHLADKLEDCGVIQHLVRICPTVSPHFPWDETDDMAAMRDLAERQNLAFDAVNSNTFQDQPDQEVSYKFGSLSHTNPAVRNAAIAHNRHCIELGQTLGSKALTVWVADGANFPGQQDLTGAFDRYLSSMEEIYAGLPDDWQVFIEHKLFEPAFYATVIADWGTSFIAAQHLGEKAKCLVDLGHHAPNTNIEMIVARLNRFGKLGGFHFNDSKYGDDDLDSGSIDPFQLFLVFNELVIAERNTAKGTFAPAYMMDQSHNLTDPIESLATSADAIACAFAAALIVDRSGLAEAQRKNDALLASQILKAAFRTDVRPLVAEARRRSAGALDPVAAYRSAGYRDMVAKARPAVTGGSGGIV